MSLFTELKRRNVFRVGLAYLLAAWVLLQIVDFVLQVIAAPDWILQVFVLAAAVGFPVVLIFSWVFEMTSEGVKRESEIDRSQSITPTTGRKLDRVIIGFLATAVVLLLADRFLATRSGAEDSARLEEVPASAGMTLPSEEPPEGVSAKQSIAVLPLLALSSGPDDEYFADGLTEELLNALSQLPELLVTARTSAFHFKGKDVPVQEIATTLGVDNIVEGSVRRSGDRLRVTVQLVRAEDGFHLWSENYDSTSEDTIEVQEDIAEKIATALNVVMDEDKREAMSDAGLRDVEAFIAFQKGLELYEHAHGDSDQIKLLQEANEYFELVTQKVPAYALAYQLHSDLYIHTLVNHAVRDVDSEVSEQEITDALEHAIADYEAGVKYADSVEERNNLELDLLLISTNWGGLPARFERFFGEVGCHQPSWAQNVAVSFGFAEQLAVRLHEFRLCDPLSPSNWMNESRAMLWAGDPAGSIETGIKGLDVAPGVWLSNTLVRALVASGQFEQAEMENTSRISSNFDVLHNQTMIASARGEGETAASLFREFQKLPDADGFFHLINYAWAGKQELANSVATSIDSRPFGTLALLNAIMWCTCGAPWELSATPNLAQRLEEAGLSWPPVEVINFPLKDW